MVKKDARSGWQPWEPVNEGVSGGVSSTVEQPDMLLGGYALVRGGVSRLVLKQPSILYSYSNKNAFEGSVFRASHAGRAWATKHAPGAWAYEPGLHNTLLRIVRTGQTQAFNTHVSIRGAARLQFSPVSGFGPVRLWKRLGGQFFAPRPGNVDLLTGQIANPTVEQAARFAGEKAVDLLTTGVVVGLGGFTAKLRLDPQFANDIVGGRF